MSEVRTILRPVEDRTLRAQVKNQILDMVLAGHFRPGEKLTEALLAAQLNVSRAPLREAMRELVDQGILVSQPYKGLHVRRVSRKDLTELYSMRTALDKFAFTLAWSQRTPAALSELEERYKRLMSIHRTGDQARAIEFEIAFHSWVYEVSDHGLLMSHWERLAPLVQIYLTLHHNLHGPRGTFRQMTTLYRNLANGTDLAEMLDHINEHMAQGFDSVVKAVPEAD